MSLIEGTFIPKTIYLCYKHKRIPHKVIANWQRLNPDFKILLFDDKDCIRFLEEQLGSNYASIFRKIPDGAIKADFWRVCVLYKMGGVYADVDIEPIKPISSFVEKGIDMLTCHSMWPPARGKGPDVLNPHFIMAPPGSPILKLCINSYFKLLLTQSIYDYWLWSITGIMAAALRDITVSGAIEGKPNNIATDGGLKVQFLQEHGPGGETIVGESPLVGCYYHGTEVLKNRYADYKNWSVRMEGETKRRNASHVGIKQLAPLRRVDTSRWKSSNLRQF